MRSFLILALMALVSPLSTEEPGGLTLQDCFNQALTHFESVKIQEEEIRAAEGRYTEALSSVLPHLSAKGSEFIQDTSNLPAADSAVGSTFFRKYRPEIAINLKQPLFQGLREFSSLSASSADKNKSRMNTERARQLLYLNTAQIFFSITQLEEDFTILQSQQEVMNRRIGELANRVKLGKSRQSEILNTEAQQGLLTAEIARVRGQLAAARETLRFLTGIPPEEKLVRPALPSTDPQPMESYLSDLEKRPDLEASNFDLKLARSKLAYEREGFLPQLSLESNYYPYRVGFQSDIQWDVLLTLNVPLFEGGKTLGLIREAKARAKQSELAKSESRRKAEMEIHQAYQTLQASRQETEALQLAANKGERNYEVQSKEYRLGLVTNLDVLQALRDWQEIRRQENRARHQTFLNSCQLQVATGKVP